MADDLFAGLVTSVPEPPTADDIWATIRKFTDPTHTMLVGPDSVDATRRAVGDAGLGLDVRVVESEFVPSGTAYVIDMQALDPPPLSAFTWDRPEANPLADIRAAYRKLAMAPWAVYQPPVFSPAAARLYAREMRQIRFREEVRRRRIADKRLRPMRVEYRRRTRRRGRR